MFRDSVVRICCLRHAGKLNMLKVGTARFQKIQNKSARGKQMLRIMARVDCMIQISVCRGRKTSLDLRAR